MKRSILKGMSIAALSLGLLISSPTITSRFDTVYAQERSGYNLKEEQVKKEYQEYYESYNRRKDRIILKEDKYIARYADKEIEVPKQFIEEFLNHLEQAKEQGYFEYLFHEDINHCHAGMPEEHFKTEYEGLSMAEIREKSLKDPKLMHLYHSRENLTPNSPKKKNRNFIGYFDGRKIKLIHPKKEIDVSVLEKYSYGSKIKIADEIPSDAKALVVNDMIGKVRNYETRLVVLRPLASFSKEGIKKFLAGI